MEILGNIKIFICTFITETPNLFNTWCFDSGVETLLIILVPGDGEILLSST